MEQLRQAIKASKLSMLAVAKKSGLPYSLIHGMITDNKSVTVITMEEIAAALNLEIIIRPKAEPEKKAQVSA